jgi:hypothetical protein
VPELFFGVVVLVVVAAGVWAWTHRPLVKPKHKHNWVVIRTDHFMMTRGYPDQIGPRTRAMWKCSSCGKMRTDDREGTWKVEDFA